MSGVRPNKTSGTPGGDWYRERRNRATHGSRVTTGSELGDTKQSSETKRVVYHATAVVGTVESQSGETARTFYSNRQTNEKEKRNEEREKEENDRSEKEETMSFEGNGVKKERYIVTERYSK